jgi:hypothetical protein
MCICKHAIGLLLYVCELEHVWGLMSPPSLSPSLPPARPQHIKTAPPTPPYTYTHQDTQTTYGPLRYAPSVRGTSEWRQQHRSHNRSAHVLSRSCCRRCRRRRCCWVRWCDRGGGGLLPVGSVGEKEEAEEAAAAASAATRAPAAGPAAAAAATAGDAAAAAGCCAVFIACVVFVCFLKGGERGERDTAVEFGHRSVTNNGQVAQTQAHKVCVRPQKKNARACTCLVSDPISMKSSFWRQSISTGARSAGAALCASVK